MVNLHFHLPLGQDSCDYRNERLCCRDLGSCVLYYCRGLHCYMDVLFVTWLFSSGVQDAYIVRSPPFCWSALSTAACQRLEDDHLPPSLLWGPEKKETHSCTAGKAQWFSSAFIHSLKILLLLFQVFCILGTVLGIRNPWNFNLQRRLTLIKSS